jgi:O-antigen biosynthesis protein WbqP
MDGVNTSVQDTVGVRTFAPRYQVRTSYSQPILAKRAFDILFSMAALILAAPILLAAVILIPVLSPGSPLFLQRRVGQHGKFFSILKLRTMSLGSDSLDFKTASDDERLTPLGRVLRATNIDELPQLINVLKGDMSLIGPRPLSVDETEYIARTLEIDLDYPGFIPQVLPGLVGLEQINRTRDLTYIERFEFNSEYQNCWSVGLDLHIFLKALMVCKDVCLACIVGATLLLVVGLAFHF